MRVVRFAGIEVMMRGAFETDELSKAAAMCVYRVLYDQTVTGGVNGRLLPPSPPRRVRPPSTRRLFIFSVLEFMKRCVFAEQMSTCTWLKTVQGAAFVFALCTRVDVHVN